MEISETRARFAAAGWYADWTRATGGYNRKPIYLLDVRRTGDNPLTFWDVAHGAATGKVPPLKFMAVDPSWGYPCGPGELVAREDFDKWVREKGNRRGRKPLLSYDEVRLVRNVKSYHSFALKPILWRVNKATYHNIRRGLSYWWVEGINPEWVGYDWNWSYPTPLPTPVTADPVPKPRVSEFQPGEWRDS